MPCLPSNLSIAALQYGLFYRQHSEKPSLHGDTVEVRGCSWWQGVVGRVQEQRRGVKASAFLTASKVGLHAPQWVDLGIGSWVGWETSDCSLPRLGWFPGTPGTGGFER